MAGQTQSSGRNARQKPGPPPDLPEDPKADVIKAANDHFNGKIDVDYDTLKKKSRTFGYP